MTSVVMPTCDELYEWNDKRVTEYDFETVSEHSDNSWRHGTRETVVFRRKSDGTFWEAKYRLSTDQECNELREGYAMIRRVYPHREMTTIYRYEP